MRNVLLIALFVAVYAGLRARRDSKNCFVWGLVAAAVFVVVEVLLSFVWLLLFSHYQAYFIDTWFFWFAIDLLLGIAITYQFLIAALPNPQSWYSKKQNTVERECCWTCQHFIVRERFLDLTNGYCNAHNQKMYSYDLCDQYARKNERGGYEPGTQAT